jgi:5-methyltetrahydrofolate--homocysteine methyltransferase
MTILTSKNGSLEFGAGHPTVLFSDQIRVFDQDSEVLDQLRNGRMDKLIELAQRGVEVGIHGVDILVDHPKLDEVDLLPKVAKAISENVGCPISLDSRNPAALDAALQAVKPDKCMVNSISAETELLDSLLPVVKKHGAAVIAMTMGAGASMPRTVEERLAEARVIIEATDRYGIPREDVVFDAMVLATSVEPNSMIVTLKTIGALIDEFGCSTLLGIGNAGHGMPNPLYIDLSFLLAAIPWGLNAALVHSETPGLIDAVMAADFLADRDTYGEKYIAHYRKDKPSRRRRKASQKD